MPTNSETGTHIDELQRQFRESRGDQATGLYEMIMLLVAKRDSRQVERPIEQKINVLSGSSVASLRGVATKLILPPWRPQTMDTDNLLAAIVPSTSEEENRATLLVSARENHLGVRLFHYPYASIVHRGYGLAERGATVATYYDPDFYDVNNRLMPSERLALAALSLLPTSQMLEQASLGGLLVCQTSQGYDQQDPYILHHVSVPAWVGGRFCLQTAVGQSQKSLLQPEPLLSQLPKQHLPAVLILDNG